jgi:hypothetical protein
MGLGCRVLRLGLNLKLQQLWDDSNELVRLQLLDGVRVLGLGLNLKLQQLWDDGNELVGFYLLDGVRGLRY